MEAQSRQKNKSQKDKKGDFFVIFGPTASGKTALSIALAQEIISRKGQGMSVIINADSLQIYQGLPILSAVPPLEERAGIDHFLFEILPPDMLISAGKWVDRAVREIHKAFNNGQTPIIVGGTGLYLKALLCGLSPIPEVPSSVRAVLETRLEKIGLRAFHEELIEKDPLATRLESDNPRRVLRAYEVYEATGKSLYHWQEKEPTIPHQGRAHYCQILPSKSWLYERCDKRFDKMIEQGAMEEIKSFKQTYKALKSNYAAKAIGFQELSAYQEGDISLGKARERAKQKTRNYAKRQMTWARTQMQESSLSPYVASYHTVDEGYLIDIKAVATVIASDK